MMKKISKEVGRLIMAVVLIFGITACSSGDDKIVDEPKQPVEIPNAPKTYILTINASKGNSGVTRALSLDGATLNATWAKGEEVTVYNVTKDASLTGTLVAQSTGTNITLKGTLTGTIESGDQLKLRFLSQDYATQDGTLTGSDTSIDKKCDYAEAVVTATVSGVNITTTAANFINQQAIVKFTLQDSDGDAISTQPLVVKINANTYTVTPSSPTSVLYVAIPGISSQTVELTATVGDNTYTYSKAGTTFTNGQYYAITVKMQDAKPEGAISGKFTINSNGKKVRFSKGNLQATTSNNGSTWSWGFATNQWSYIGQSASNVSINGNGTVTTNGTVDLFGWSTNNTNNTVFGINNSTTSSDYTGDFIDWGNNINDNGWHTLSKEEWIYLLATRPYSNNKQGLATVNGTYGLVLLPDSWSLPADCSFTPGNSNWNTNTYDSEKWSQMENAGAVFLPAGGRRNANTVTLQDNDNKRFGNYWTSTSYNGDIYNSYYLTFMTTSISCEHYSRRYFGYSVRLVKDAN